MTNNPENEVARQHNACQCVHMTNTIAHRYTMKVRPGAGVWILEAMGGTWRKLVPMEPDVDSLLTGEKRVELAYLVTVTQGRCEMAPTFDLTAGGRTLTVGQ